MGHQKDLVDRGRSQGWICNFDDYDRPVAGAINFCLEQVDLEEDGGTAHHAIIDDNVDVAIHEIGHILGMSSNSFRFFWDPKTGTPRTNRPFSYETVLCVDGVERVEILPDKNTLKFFDNWQGYGFDGHQNYFKHFDIWLYSCQETKIYFLDN